MTGVVRVPLAFCGAALVVAGIGLTSSAPHPSIIGDRSVAEVVLATGTWRLMHYALAIAAIAMAVGVIGIVASYDGRLGLLGYAAVTATIVGSVVTAAVMLMEAVLFPLVAERAPDLISLDGPVLGSWWLRLGGGLAGGVMVGLVGLGFLAYREGTRRRAGLALIGSTLLYLALGFWFVPYAGPASAVLFGSTIVWWGAIVWRAATTPA